jgi:hypothetical protein
MAAATTHVFTGTNEMDVLVVVAGTFASIQLAFFLAKAILIGIFSVADMAQRKHPVAGHLTSFVNT